MLEDIGFYTLSDARCEDPEHNQMQRCELILTNRCNFACPYCRNRGEEMTMTQAVLTLEAWQAKNVRFSGGEPTLWKPLDELVLHAKNMGAQRIALSTNGSAHLTTYLHLLNRGVNDFSVSFDACCASEQGEMAGKAEQFDHLCNNIRELSKRTYVTVGVVLTDTNADSMFEIVTLAHSLGVADIRIIPAAQNGAMIKGVEAIPQHVVDTHPILKHRVVNLLAGLPVRSLTDSDSTRCYLPMDDSIVSGNYHYPCVIKFREGCEPVGKVGPTMRADRIKWSESHNTHKDPICKEFCLDFCAQHNNTCRRMA